MKKIKLLLSLFAVLCLIACNEGNVDLDNAGEDALKVTVDGQLYLLKGGERQLLSLDPGLHSIKIEDIANELLLDSTFQVFEGGLLNVARGEYLIWTDVFSPESTLAFRKQALNTQQLKIDRKVYDLDYEMLPQNRIYTEKKWDYGLTEDFPKKVYGWEIDKGKKYMIKKKLVRFNEFEKIYMKALMP